MNNLHTPGPWKWVELEFCGKYHELQDQSGVVICDDGSASGEYSPEIDVNGANARLIASAPELLGALEKIKIRLEVYLDDERDMAESSMQVCLDYAQQAIAKARGEQC